MRQEGREDLGYKSLKCPPGASNLSWAPVSPPHLPSLLSGCVTLDRSPYHLPSLSSSRELQILTRSLERCGEAPGPEAAVVLVLGGSLGGQSRAEAHTLSGRHPSS